MIALKRGEKTEKRSEARSALQLDPTLENGFLENARRHLAHRVVMRQALARQGGCHKARKRPGRWENNSKTSALFVGEKLMGSRGDRFDLFAHVQAGQEDCRARGWGSIEVTRDKLRFPERFFPGTDPGGVEIV